MSPGHNSSFSYYICCIYCCASSYVVCAESELNEDSGEAVCLYDQVRDLIG